MEGSLIDFLENSRVSSDFAKMKVVCPLIRKTIISSISCFLVFSLLMFFFLNSIHAFKKGVLENVWGFCLRFRNCRKNEKRERWKNKALDGFKWTSGCYFFRVSPIFSVKGERGGETVWNLLFFKKKTKASYKKLFTVHLESQNQELSKYIDQNILLNLQAQCN